ncbi:hypothetical protein ACFW1A_34555 [Kitasatospora sp. NPDC058965]|uniref:hypothetical protein n=1 Tax=Kitasatospora sp. NPDC058965 TaxID=3346682 RepID=UPI00368B6D26
MAFWKRRQQQPVVAVAAEAQEAAPPSEEGGPQNVVHENVQVGTLIQGRDITINGSIQL